MALRFVDMNLRRPRNILICAWVLVMPRSLLSTTSFAALHVLKSQNLLWINSAAAFRRSISAFLVLFKVCALHAFCIMAALLIQDCST